MTLPRIAPLPGDEWDDGARHLDDDQRLDLIFTVGCYQLLALAVNTLAIEPEDH